MITITIPKNNVNERTYIIDILFGEFLGLEYIIELDSSLKKEYIIVLENGNKLIIEDHFFSKYPNDLEYLKLENIPQKINYQLKSDNKFLSERDIPIIYGEPKIAIETTSIVCGIDIFASSFFMLSRWEEYVNKTRDTHNRFPAKESLAYQCHFLDRPVVNEYVELLWALLSSLDSQQVRKIRQYNLLLTHDIDFIQRYRDLKDLVRRVGGDIIIRKNLLLPFKTVYEYICVKLNIYKDPYNTFDTIMDMSESIGLQSYFFFMGEGKTKYDNLYNPNTNYVKNIIESIKNRNHCIGIHPTYNAYNDFEQFKNERTQLEDYFNLSISYGREHFLRFTIPETWEVWESNNMKWDSTVGYPDMFGFRSGVCYEHNVFNILRRRKMELKEKPLLVMETTFSTYQSTMTTIDLEEQISDLIKKVQHYNGELVVLWHNSNFTGLFWKKYKKIYKMFLLSFDKEPNL